tara:strand:+ start:2304 stop:3743 length:1440 start_codon:yes stop_codon:yes gene_type:complete
MQISETRLRKIIYAMLAESKSDMRSSMTNIGKRLAAASDGVYKLGSLFTGQKSRNAPHIRMNVNNDTGDDKLDVKNKETSLNLSKSDFLKYIEAAGLEFTGDIIPRLSTPPEGQAGIPVGNDKQLSKSRDAYRVKDPGSGEEYYVVFAGGSTTSLEAAQIQGISDQLRALIVDGSALLISPDPSSEFDELRRPRWVRTIEKVPGTPKADAKMPGVNGEYDSIYISLKGGTQAKHHQQWSGFTQHADYGIIRDFVKRVISVSDVNDGKIYLPSDGKTRPFHMEMGNSPEEMSLKTLSVYGPDALPINQKNFGVDKIHMVVQAPMPQITAVDPGTAEALRDEFVEFSTIPGEMIYTLGGAHKVSYPEIPEGSYTPVLHARYDGTSRLKIGNLADASFLEKVGLDPSESTKGVRFLVYPTDKLPKRSLDIEAYELAPFTGGLEGDALEKIKRVPQKDSIVTAEALRLYVRNMLLEFYQNENN